MRRVIWLLAAGVMLAAPQVQAAPDILVILADDVGAAQIGPEKRIVPTPNLDALGASGVVYTSGYAPAPMCVPSRNGLLSGFLHWRKSIGGGSHDNGPPLPGKVLTIAERLKPLGYATHAVGKWHLNFTRGTALNNNTGQHPLAQGFDTFFGYKGKKPNDFGPDSDSPLYDGFTAVANAGYLNETLANRTVQILQAPGSQPKFVYLALPGGHHPYLQGTTLKSNLTQTDQVVGRVLAATKPDTLVFFLGDNGLGNNKPYRGGKYDIFSGGVRVTFHVRWPGHFAPGVRHEPVSGLDIAPTVIAAAGGSFTGDGYNLLQPLPTDRGIYFEGTTGDSGRALRSGPWTLYKNYAGYATALFNVTTDKGETKNVASQNGAVVNALTAIMNGYTARMKD